MERDPQKYYYRRTVDDDFVGIATNYIFGVPLYAYYAFSITLFQPGTIVGILLSSPIWLIGPLETFEEAKKLVDDWVEAARTS